MGFALVAHTKAQGTANGVTSAAINTTGATLLALFLSSFEGKPDPTIIDSFGNQFSAAHDYTETTTRGQWWYCNDPVVGAGHTVTVTGTQSFPAVDFSAWANPNTTAFPDAGSGSSTAASVTSIQPGSVTPSANGDLCLLGVACGLTGAPGAPSIDSGFTLLDSAANVSNTALGVAAGYLVQAAAAPINPTISWTNGSDASCAILCFKSVATGGGGEATPPPAPTLSVADNTDGSGATATIAGSTAGCTNTIDVVSLTANGSLSWVNGGSRTSDGMVSLSLADGHYLAIAVSTLNALDSPPSNPYEFFVTGGTAQPLIRAALFSYLSANAGIAAQAGARIYPVKLPQGAARPALVYRRIKGGHAHDLSGSAGRALARFELACLSDTYAAADSLAEAVRQAADGAQDKVAAGITIRAMLLADDEDETDDFCEPLDGGDTGVYAIQLRYDVLYDESVPTP